ncbi:NAD(P)-dependent oxidoreductase [Rhodocytophaga rosea]|uniref:NAD(P)-dependent oxidoreductase n=1 Tax=Rhodocytophaga rosea TaxID=2704465 RepID=A0A6C0GJS4_9BACT|nr:NAD(P)-dependent oxidoreductase [Rhodocytophaga rosea]QHT68064.1 NAD(P)-dependent oxidoreductase [Rhodocytophaga rosea]
MPELENTIVIHRLYRGLDERDGAAAHVLALEKKMDSFQIFNVSAKSPFQPEDMTELKTNPKQIIFKYYPEAEMYFHQRIWVFPSYIDRVYVVDKAIQLLGYQPQHNFKQLIR